jgi:hypothetical protein
MPQIFHRSTNTISRFTIYGFVFVVAAGVWTAAELQRSPYMTRQNEARVQPIQFSHQHHVGGMGIDCRYCHTTVEVSPFAGIPPTKTCMNCHAQIWSDAPMLEPVRASFATGQPLQWTRVHDLPGFAYFDHSIHVNKGVGCASCHGQVDQMPLMHQAQSLQMEWCLDCHRAPEKHLRPREQVFNMQYRLPSADHPLTLTGEPYEEGEQTGERFVDQATLGEKLKQLYRIRSAQDLTSCSTCHR